MSLILAIDPGLANTGVVLLGKQMIYAAATLKTSRDHSVPEFEDAVSRSDDLAQQLRRFMALHAPAGVSVAVVESYRDFGGGHKRGVKGRWTTPLAIGLLIPDIRLLSDEIVFQDPAEVMCAGRDYIALWKARKSVWPGDRNLTNEHLRSAAAHGIYYLGGRR